MSSNTPKPVTVDQKSSQSNASAEKSATKPVLSEAEQQHERMLRLVSELPSEAPVFVLVPWDDHEMRQVKSQLDEQFTKYFPEPPAVHHELKVARLPYGSQLFVAHCHAVRAKREDGTFGPVHKLHISDPIDLKAYTSRSADGYTWNTDIGSIIDAVTASCKHGGGFVWLGMSSGDKNIEQRVVKLSKT